MKIIIVMIFTKIIDVPSAFTYPWLRPHMARGACDAVEDDRGLHWPWRVEDSFKTPNPISYLNPLGWGAAVAARAL
jgi:hypothetical protein